MTAVASRCAMIGIDKAIRWSTAAAVIGVAVVAAVVSYEHAYALVRAHGETGWTARLIPLTVDGLIWGEQHGHPRLRASSGAGARVRAVAAGPGHRGHASGECSARPGPRSDRRTCGGVASVRRWWVRTNY